MLTFTSSNYTLTVSGYSGTAGDSLTNAALLQATVYITSLAQEIKIMMCGVAIVHRVSRVPAWWYGYCHSSNFNSLYHGGSHLSFADGVNWAM